MDGQSHTALFVTVPGIPPTECHAVIFKRKQPVSRDSDAVRIASQIAHHILGSAERAFGVDHPIFPMNCPKQFPKGSRASERSQHALQHECSSRVQFTETFDELAPKDLSQYLYRKEESRRGVNPAGMIQGQSAGRNDTMH